MDWFKIGKGVCQGCILSLCLFNFYAVYIMQNAGLNEAQIGIQIAGRNINISSMWIFLNILIWENINTNYEKFLKRWEYQTTLPASWETCMQI